jgi:membrane protein implicated in regulation of membrane protease activity
MDWLIWLIAAAVFGVGEMFTLSLFLAPFAGGALLAALAAGLGAGAALTWGIFLVVAVALLAALRPLARSHRRTPPRIRTNTAALIGRDGLVVERISNGEGAGCVKIDGEIWTARAFDDDEVFEAGKRVSVVEIRGATALVSE